MLDLRIGLLGAHALEVLLAGAGLRDPLSREVPGLDLLQDLSHARPRLLGEYALGAVPRCRRRLDAHSPQPEITPANPRLLAEQVGLGLVLEARLDHAAAG